MTARLPVLAAALAVLAAPAAQACGVCAEDKIAATYDHATIQKAAANGRVMVFCEIGGSYETAKVKAAARRVRGLDAASLRLSEQPAALSFALDTKQQSPQAAVLAIQAAAPAGTRLNIIRVVTPQGW